MRYVVSLVGGVSVLRGSLWLLFSHPRPMGGRRGCASQKMFLLTVASLS